MTSRDSPFNPTLRYTTANGFKNPPILRAHYRYFYRLCATCSAPWNGALAGVLRHDGNGWRALLLSGKSQDPGQRKPKPRSCALLRGAPVHATYPGAKFRTADPKLSESALGRSKRTTHFCSAPDNFHAKRKRLECPRATAGPFSGPLHSKLHLFNLSPAQL